MSSGSVSCLPLEIDYLPDIFREKAEVEFNETTENRIQGLLNLKEMTKGDDVLREWDFHDDFLLQFLRHSKFNVDKAFTTLRNFVFFRSKYSSMFESVDFDVFIKKSSSKFFSVLPKRCPDGCTVMVVDMGKWDPGELSFEDLKRINVLVLTQSLRNPLGQINGFKMIYDFTNASIRLLTYVSPRNMIMLAHGSGNCFPIRFTEIHLVSESVVLKATWSMLKHFLSEKIRSRVLFHSTRDSVSKHFPPCVLPSQYGGLLTDYYMEEWMRKANQQQKVCTMSGQCNDF